MWINRLRVTGDMGFDYSFGKTNVLLGTNESGKTTFVNLMLYALGAKINSFIDEISKFEFCDYVRVDVVTKSNNRYEIVRKLPYVDNVTVIPFDDKGNLRTEEVQILNLEEYSDFLLIEEKYPKNVITYSATKTATITYRFLLRAALVDQFTPPHKVLANVLGDRNDFMNNQEMLNTAIIEEILNTLNQELQRLRLELKQKDKNRIEINNQISFFSNMRMETSTENEMVYKKVEKIDADLKQLENERTKLHDFRYEQLRKLENTNDREVISGITKLRSRVNSLKSNLMQISLEIKDLEDMLPLFEKELELLKKQLASQRVLINIPVTICPVCLSPVDGIETTGLCSHCGENSFQEVLDSAAAYKRTIEDTIKELTILATQKKQEEIIQKTDLIAAEKDLSKIEKAYVEQLNDIKQPVEHLVQEIEKRLEYITERSYKLREIRRILVQLNLLRSRKGELAKEMENLRWEIEEQEKKSSKDAMKFNKFQEVYKDLFELIYGVEHDISINPDNYMPIIDGSPILSNSNHSASIKVVSRLAYIITLFLLNRYLENTMINNMKFIIFDSPRDKELDIDKYERFLELVHSQDEGQVFLTGSYKETEVFYKVFPEKEGCYIDQLTDDAKLLKQQEES